MTTFLPPSYSYPFALVSKMTYRLEADNELHVIIRAQNVGGEIAPYGVGVHPYLTCNQHPIDDCELILPANEETCDKRDFATQRRVAQITIDHTFRTIPPDAEWGVRITSPLQSMSIFLRSHQSWLQVCTGEKLTRRGFAAEPMTCPSDAFNSGTSLIHLAPGEIHQMHFLVGNE